MTSSALLWFSLGLWPAIAQTPETSTPIEESTEDTAAPKVPAAEGAAAFLDVARVLQHPRCSNCHPEGHVPLQGDDGHPHTMQIDRFSFVVGLPCTTCHRFEGLSDLPNLPPANSPWMMAPPNQVFKDRTAAELCAQLNDPANTGGRDRAALLHHVENDTLVLYGWNPGPGQTTPPLSHEDFVAKFQTWVDSGGVCPE